MSSNGHSSSDFRPPTPATDAQQAHPAFSPRARANSPHKTASTRPDNYHDDDANDVKQEEKIVMADDVRVRATMESRVESFSVSETAFRLQDHVNIHHLQQLMETFHLAGTGLSGYDITTKTGTATDAAMRQGQLTMVEFREALVEILGPAVDTEQMELLFMKVDMTCDGLVNWDEFCTYLLLQLQEMDCSENKKTLPFGEEPSRIITNLFSKEVTVRIMCCSNPNRLVSVTKDGVIATWSPDFKLQRSFCMESHSDSVVFRMLGTRRRNVLWVTDCIAMNNCSKLAVSTTSRDIWFYDMACAQYTCQYRLFDLPNVPLCLDYWYDEKNPSGTSLLMYGDDSGNITLLYFQKPQQHLFDPIQKSWIQIYMQDLGQHSRYVQYTVIPGVHTDWVRQLRYMPESNSILSCSGSPINSMSIRDIERKKKLYVFKLRKGISCFDYSRNWNIIATGSVDHVVRLWNPVSNFRPVALLKGHLLAVLGVLIHEELGQIISYSQDVTLKTWDMREYVCIQSVSWKYPTTRTPDHGSFVLFLSPLASNMLLLSCNNFVTEFRLQGVGKYSTRFATTHSSPICSVVYNSSLKQVATGCEECVVTVWDINTGQRVLQLSNVHDTDLTTMALDSKNRRLFTGSRSGHIKIWNFSNGQCLKNLVPNNPGDITGIIDFPDKKQILAVGWSRILTGYTDIHDTYVTNTFHSGPDDSWLGGHVHKEDILTADYCPPYYLATGSFDGEILIWGTDSEKLLKRLRMAPMDLPSSHSDRGVGSKLFDKSTHSGVVSQQSLVRSRRMSRTSQKQLSAPTRGAHGFMPVFKLLFLTERARARGLESAILVSVDGPDVHFWHLFHAHLLSNMSSGTLRAAQYDDEIVHALATDDDNKFLITGDSLGFVSVWDIEHYLIDNSPASFRNPSNIRSWRAHAGVVTDLKYASHDFCPLLISMSDDCTARLWNMNGHFVGTFGQETAWNVREPSTYQHPMNPWGERRSMSEGIPSRPGSSRPVTAKTSEGERILRSAVSIAARKAIRSSKSRTGKDPHVESKPNISTKAQVQAQNTDADSNRSPAVPSITNGGDNKEAYTPAATTLGETYLRQYNRRMRDRQERRNGMGEVDITQALRFGTLCSPFQTLYTPLVEDVEIPKSLPTVPKFVTDRSQPAAY
ncbi:WD repeat-containing protein on Y chromosome-like [Corticium candelabrum]|uniref:WD repeat-containing protein on Y chromosome-like n=1 Tax=Corticium candelabrum TaxID=121492 RepID=UPI002E346E00|nr:WD repeat-containing protein on Y chromosome-like [Corticium candelabrum]